MGDGEHEHEILTWPRSVDITEAFDVPAAVRRAAAEVDPAAVVSRMRDMSREQLRGLGSHVGLRNLNRPTPGIANRLKDQVVRSGDMASLHAVVCPLSMVLVARSDENAHADWSAFLAGERDLPLEMHDGRDSDLTVRGAISSLLYEYGPSLEKALLVEAISCARNPAVAFTMLAAVDDEAAQAHALLRSDFPDLPPIAGSLFSYAWTDEDSPEMPDDGAEDRHENRHEARPDAQTVAAPTSQDAAPGASRAEPGAASESSGAMVGAVAGTSVADRVAALDWERAAEVADQVVVAFDAQRSPSVESVELLVAFAREAHAVAAVLAELTGTTVDASVAAFEDAAASLAQSGEEAVIAAAMAGLTGPAHAAAAVEEIRRLALSPDENALVGLRALYLLVRAGLDRRANLEVDLTALSGWESDVRTHLPASTHQLSMLAAFGDLTPATVDSPAVVHPVSAAAPDAATLVDAVAVVDEEAKAEDVVDSVATAGSTAPVEDTATLAELPSAPPTEPVETAEPVDADDTTDTANTPVMPDRAEASEAPEAMGSGEPSAEEPAPDLDGETETGPAEAPVEPVVESLEEVDVEALRAALRDQLTAPAPAALPLPHETHDDTPAVGADDEAGGADELAAAAEAAEIQLIASGRFGLAAALHTDPARHGARAMAAYQSRLTAAAGPLAAAFAEAAANLSRDRLADDRAGQLLAWGSAARVAIVAPATGAASVLTNLAPCVADYPALTAVGAAFTEAALAGAFVAPDAARAISSVQETDSLARNAAERAAELVATSVTRQIKYIPANGVYQAWMQPDGLLGSLLRTVADADAARSGEVLARVTSLRGDASRNIDDTWAKRRQVKKGKLIIGGARSTLINLYNEALDVAAEWAENAHHSIEQRSHWGAEDRAAKPLDKLRTKLDKHRAQSLDELDAIRSASDADPSEAAAAQAVFTMLTTAFAISDGNPPVGREPSPEFAVRGELLSCRLNLDHETLEPLGVGPDELATTVIALSGQAVATPAHTYELRATEGRHDLTGVLVDNLSALGFPEAPDLIQRREHDLAAAHADLSRELEQLENQVGVNQRDATLPDDVATTLFARLAHLRSTPQLDFGRAAAELTDIADVITGHQHEQVQDARTLIMTIAAENQAVAAHRDLLTQLVDKGEVAGALEYVEQLVTHGKLPDPRVEDKHFGRFYPRVPELAATVSDLLNKLRDHYDTGASHAAVDELFAIVETSSTDIPDSAKKGASRAIGAWQAANRGGENVTSILRPIMALAGFEFTDATVQQGSSPRSSGRQWIRLSGVTGSGYALSPALGSQMSAGGSSLRVLVVNKPTTPATLADWLRSERQEDTVVVLNLARAYTPEERRALAGVSRGRPRPVAIVIDRAVLAYLAVQPQPSRATLAALTLPFTADVPYRPRAGRTSPEMFYGRSKERSEVANLDGASFVSGGRQLGKSALLWSAKDEFESSGAAHKSVLLEIRSVGSQADPEQVWPRLMSALVDADIVDADHAPGAADGAAVTAAVRSWLDADPERRLLVLLDEADMFLEADAVGNRFDNISLCKTLMDATHRRVKFVFAGLHRTVRFESLPNQPLAHLGPPVIVGPLSPQPAYSLLTQPLSVLGYRFADPQIQPARILAFTNNVPSLLQLFGQALVTRLNSRELVDGPPTVITDDDITEVLEDTNLQEQIRDKYLLTLDLDDRYKVIVYTVAYNALTNGVDNGMTLTELEEQCTLSWPEGFAEVSIDHLRGLIAECCDLGVLAHDQGRYRMRTQTMLRLLGTTESIEEVLTNPTRLQLPSSTDADHHRVALPASGQRSPLTSRQVAQVLGAGRRCFIVSGSEALGVQWVSPAFEHLNHEGASRGRAVGRFSNLTESGIRTKIERTTESSVLIADMRGLDADKVLAVRECATEALAATQVPVTVVLATDASAVLAWTRTDELIEIGRVSGAGLRMWCEEADTPFLVSDHQEQLMEVTGGWPKLIIAAIADAAKTGTGAGPALEKMVAQRADLARATAFLTEAGLWRPATGANRLSQPTTAVLRAALLTVADLTGSRGEQVEDLIAVLEVAETPEGAGLEQTAKEAGFEDMEQVLLALRALGALRVDTAGRVSAEPVLYAALRTVLDAGAANGGAR